jgi:hypothetical protein
MLTLGGACTKEGGLSSLRSFTSTIYKPSTDAWITGTELLLKESPLEDFQSYMPEYDSGGALADTFCVRVVNQHRDLLVRFSFHRQCISLGAVEHVCISCPRLEELFVTVKFTEMVYLPFFFGKFIYRRIIRRTLYRYLPRQRIYVQCISLPQTDRSRGMPLCMHWTSPAKVVQRFPWLESKQMSGK